MRGNRYTRVSSLIRHHILILLLGFTSAGYAQQVLGRVYGLFSTHFDSTSRRHYQFFRDSVSVLDLDGKFIEGFRIPDLSQQLPDFQPLIVKGEIWMVHRNGGIIYRVSRDGLRRLDKSYEHRMQAGSLIFTRNDTLFRHGGYGFWSARRELIYFNTSSSEWELYILSRESELPPALFSHYGVLNNDKLTVFMGCTIHPKDPLNIVQESGVWELDFKSKKWTFIGSIRQEKDNPSSGTFAGLTGNQVMTFSGKMKVSAIDPEANRITTFEASPVFLQVARDSGLKPFVANGYYYFYRARDPHRDPKKQDEVEMEFCKMPLDKFLVSEVESRSFFDSPPYASAVWLIPAAAGLTVLVVLVLWRLFRRRSKTLLRLDQNILRAGRQAIQLSDPEADVIRLLLNAQGDITTNQILDITSNPGQDHTYNLKMKNQLIDKLNDEMALMLGIETDIITTERTKTDRRIKKYLIRKEYFSN